MKIDKNGGLTGVSVDPKKKSTISGDLLKPIAGVYLPSTNHFCFKVKNLMLDYTYYIGQFKAKKELLQGQLFNPEIVDKPSEGKAFQL